jgi:hypothetical protein
MFIPDPGSKFFYPGSGTASKNLSILTQKIVSKISEILSGMFIPDLDLDLLPIPYPGGSKKHRIPDPGVKKAPDPGSGYETLYITELFVYHEKF